MDNGPEEPMNRFVRWLNNPCKDEPTGLQQNEHWKVTVWALRVGYVGLAIAVVGVLAISFGFTSWILAAGVSIWVAAVAVTLIGFFWTRHDLPEPRPGYWSMRFMLIRDTFHSRSLDQ
ncbi:MAG: hypothetical protein WAL61_09360 [Acidimicrobiales bacterium]